MNYNKELDFAKALALKAGEIIVKNFSTSTVTVKENNTPVTETDIAISTLVIAEVARQFPDHVVMDEELQNTTPTNEFVWVCDPVDGTVPFAYHIPTSMFSIALCQRGVPVVAVVYDPYMKRLLYTKSGDLSYMNGKEIRVKQGGFSAGDFIYGIPYSTKGFDMNKYILRMIEKKVHVTQIESLVYQGMLVALGITRAMVSVAAMPWDRAAIKLIIENAGGVCTDEYGKPLPVFGDPKLFVATNSIIHEEVLDVVQKCFRYEDSK